MFNFKGKDDELFWEALNAAGHWAHELDGVWQYSDGAAIQAFVDAYVPPMPKLKPTQFMEMIAGLRLVPLIDHALNMMSLEFSPGAQAIFKSAYAQFKGGTVYYWDRSLAEWNKLAPLFDLIYEDVYGEDAPPFDVDEDKLREAWIAASKIIY